MAPAHPQLLIRTFGCANGCESSAHAGGGDFLRGSQTRGSRVMPALEP